MSKFSNILKEHGEKYGIVAEQEPASVAEPAPEEVITQPVEPEQLSSEGKKFMISLGLKALRIDSDLLTEDDLFKAATDVTDDTADNMLDWLMTKVEEHK
jgi:hypothetical protein|tara:strand:+ start:1337 stop:1636 length:300 start_codon:yes stop_codon:yes gene_type:complete